MSSPLGLVPLDEAMLDEVASNLDLRDPNKEAIEVLALSVNNWYEQGKTETFEGVIDSATGMGKTFIIAGAIDYYVGLGVRNFAVITPNTTILNKTVAQFSPGPKSLVDEMTSKPKVITSDNFDTSEVSSALTDDSVVKLFVFSVQSLLRPTSKLGRRTHEFREGLGGKFYEHLDSLEDLILFADEHHTYTGKKFSEAVRDLTPMALVGLTGTPHKSTQDEDIIYRYPLAAAIANEYVKTPVLVGRKDDRTDEQTQLLDGASLLETKEKALRTFCASEVVPFVHPIMLVNCRDITHSNEIVAYLKSDQFRGGAYAEEGIVLEIHSDKPDKSLEDLDRIEEPGNPCRIIVQVGMLKEGWDVKNVYVIASLRASFSEILTEQTMGRGLRLPFGKYVSMPLLNELDILAHERYQELLKRTSVLKEGFIDKRTVIERFTNAEGETEIGVTTGTVDIEVSGGDGVSGEMSGEPGSGGIFIQPAEGRIERAEKEAEAQALRMRTIFPPIQIPVVKTEASSQAFLLQQITDEAPFRELGRRLAVEPEEYLKRTKVGGVIVESEGSRIADITTDPALQKVESAKVLDDPDKAKDLVIAGVMGSRIITSRKGEPAGVARLLGSVLEGAGDQANTILSSYRSALVANLIREIERAKNRLPSTSQAVNSVELVPFAPRRMEKSPVSVDRRGGKFEKGLAYTGWKKGLFDQARFDSSPERDAANILDDADEIDAWARLEIGDLPILWRGGDRNYNPDLLAVGTDGRSWVVEIKADNHMTSEEVQAKRHAALEWANMVSAETEKPWGYLLVSESDLEDANGSWKRLLKATSV